MAEEDNVIDLGDPVDVKKRNRSVKDDLTIRTEALKQLMGTRQGRAWMGWLLSLCNIGANPFDSNGLRMAFKAGELNIGNQLLAELTTRETIDLYTLMLKEAGEKS